MSLTRIVLVGAPGTGKNELAARLASELGNEWKTVSTEDFSWLSDRVPLGPITDYRVELSLALWRAVTMASDEPTVFAGSLLDSLAHVCVSSADSISATGEVKKEVLLGGLVYLLVVDSFNADLVFFLPFEGSTEDRFAEELDSIYHDIFFEFGLTPLQLSGTLDEKAEKVLKVINENAAAQK